MYVTSQLWCTPQEIQFKSYVIILLIIINYIILFNTYAVIQVYQYASQKTLNVISDNVMP